MQINHNHQRIMMTALQRQITKRIVLFDFTLFAHRQTRDYSDEKYCEKVNHLGKKIYTLLETYVRLFGVQNIFILSNQSNEYIQKSVDQCLSNQVQNDKHNESKSRNYWHDICSSFLCSNSENSISIISTNQAHDDKKSIFRQIVISHFELNQARASNTKYVIASIGDSNDGFLAAKQAQSMMEIEYGIPSRYVVLNRFRLREKASLNVLHNEMLIIKDICNDIYEAKVESAICYDEFMEKFTQQQKVKNSMKKWKMRLGNVGLL